MIDDGIGWTLAGQHVEENAGSRWAAAGTTRLMEEHADPLVARPRQG